MSTKREAILAEIASVLENVIYGDAGALADRIFRSRRRAVDRLDSPAIVVEPIRDDPDNETIHRLTWRLLVRISIVVRGEIADQIADPILEAIHSALMADVSLGGRSMDIEPGSVNFELLEVDGGGGIIPVDYTVVYQTARESMSEI